MPLAGALRLAVCDKTKVAILGVWMNGTSGGEMMNAVHREIKRPVAMMRNQCEMLELLTSHCVGFEEIAHIDHVSFDDLIERRGRIRPQHRRNHLLVDRSKHVRNKAE